MSKNEIRINEEKVSQYDLIISKAMNSDSFDIEKMQKLMEMKEKWEANESKKAYNIAFSKFKAECPTILKTSKGHNYKYADLGLMVEAVTPVLSKYGLTHSWSMQQSMENNIIKVTCCLKHVEGHSECVSMQSAPDTGGSIKGIQGIGSAKTYLERYTFTAITGIAVKGEDTDGVDPTGNNPNKKISQQDILWIEEVISANKVDPIKFDDWLKKTFRVDKRSSLTEHQFFKNVEPMLRAQSSKYKAGE